MSLRQHPETVMDGWDGPYYPPLIINLGRTFESRPPGERSRSAVANALRGLPSYVGLSQPAPTADGCQWFWCLEFDVHGGKVLVALPRVTDTSRADDSSLDRCPAVYTQGPDVDVVAANAVLARVIRVLRPGPHSGRRPVLGSC